MAAVANNRVIGLKNSLPWNYPEDLANFKEITLGDSKLLLMGNKTYNSIPIGKVSGQRLAGRKLVVYTSKYKEPEGNTRYTTDIYDTVNWLGKGKSCKELFVIGGSSVFEYFLDNRMASDMYITEINKSYKGDTYFPKYSKDLWQEVSRTPLNKECDFVKYKFVAGK